MDDHAKYFYEHSEEVRTAETIGFYHDRFVYQQRYGGIYGNDPRLPALKPSDLPISEHGKLIFSAGGIGELLASGLAPLIEIVASRNPGLDLQPLSRVLTTDDVAPGFAADAILTMDLQRLEQFAIANMTGTDEAIFVIINWLKPFFIALRENNQVIITGNDELRHCPFCGYQPDMAAIVSGKDGKRFLYCSLCEHRWQYRRIACAVCGTEEAASLEYL